MGSGLTAAMMHVLADTLILDSVFVATTIWVTGLLEGYSIRQLVPQFRKDYVPALKAGCATSIVVMPVELPCFRYLPLSFRVLAVNFIDIFWDAIISHMAHKSRGVKVGAILEDSQVTEEASDNLRIHAMHSTNSTGASGWMRVDDSTNDRRSFVFVP